MVGTRSAAEQWLGKRFEGIYLILNEGYAARASEDWRRPVLCKEALRLGRLLAELLLS